MKKNKQAEQTEKPQDKKTLRVENDTPFTKETLKKFYKKMKNLGVIFIFIGVIFVLCSFLPIFRADKDSFGTIIAAGVVIIGCGIALLSMYKTAVKNNRRVTNETHTIYRFYDDEWTVSDFDGKTKRGESQMFYHQIVKVKVRGGYYQLFLGNLAVLVDKSAFTVGTEDDFKNVLKEKCAQKAVKIQ